MPKMPPKGDPSRQEKPNHDQDGYFNVNNWEWAHGGSEDLNQKGNNFQKNPNFNSNYQPSQGNGQWKKKHNKGQGQAGRQGPGSVSGSSTYSNSNGRQQFQNAASSASFGNGSGNSNNRGQQQRERPRPPVTATITSGSNSSRSQASLTSDGISSSAVQDIVSCPICFGILRAPIYNCESGHSVCEGCKEQTPCCALCRKRYTNARNYTLESLVENCTFKCSFHEQGCVAMVKGHEEEKHAQECNFRPLGCEIFPCKTKHIDYTAYVSHMKNTHRSGASPVDQTKFGREVQIPQMDKLMRQSCWAPFIMECFGNTFLQFAQVIGGKMWFWVSLLGTPEEAGRYRATLTMSAKDREMKSIWMGPVHSVRHSGDDIYFHGFCMVTTEECLRAFIHYNQAGGARYNMEVAIDKLR